MLQIKDVSKIYHNKDGSEFKVIDNLSLNLAEGEFVAVVGPSGSGKTTLLSLAAGLELPTSGEILHSGEKVEKPHFNRGVVFQNFSLFPWLNVQDNIAFGLKIKKLPKLEIKNLVKKYLKLIKLEDFSHFLPKNLSGGMQQRVAIARTLASNPEVVLMDEPFGALDAQTKAELQQSFIEIWEQEKKTVLFITHDIAEAVFLADKVCVMSPRPGKIIQTFNVPFARPRTPNLKKDPKFIEMVWNIQNSIV